MRIMNMRRIPVIALIFALLFSGSPLLAAPAGRATQGTLGTVSGTASNSTGQAIAKATVQLRDVATGQLVSTTQSGATGAFTFTGVPAGNFVVEVVNAAGQIIGTSASITVAAGATIAGVAVSVSAAVGAAAAGGISTAVIITTVAVGAGIAGAVALATNDASPSR